jgi:hypothetical protein
MASHHAARFEQAAVGGQAEQLVHGGAGLRQVADGLEQRHDVDGQRAFARQQQAGFLQQQGDFEHVGNAVGLRDDDVLDGAGAVAQVHLARRAEDRQFAGGLCRVGDEGRGEQARRGELGQQQGDAAVLGAAGVVGAGARGLEQFVHGARMDDAWMPNGSRVASQFFFFLAAPDGTRLGFWRPNS